MAFTEEVKYFNSFWVKKSVNEFTLPTTGTVGILPVWPGVVYRIYDATEVNDYGGTYPNWNDTGATLASNMSNVAITGVGRNNSWIIEESRIKGAYNTPTTDYGVKAYLVEDSNDQDIRSSSLIYSGLVNTKTGFNNTNVFSSADNIIRAANPAGGSIQKLHAEENNLVVLQENKSSRALIDKDTIYTSEGGTQTQAAGTVIGQIEPYAGEWGISKNPESFAYFGIRKYYVDKNRNSVLRLSHDGVTPISKYGMFDYFRDELVNIDDEVYEYSVEYLGGTQTPSWPYPATGVAPVVGEPYFKLLSLGVGTVGDDIEIGMGIFLQKISNGEWINTNLFVKDINYGPGLGVGTVQYTNAGTTPGTFGLLPDLSLYEPAGSTANFKFVKYSKDKIHGDFDIYSNNYLVSLQQTQENPTHEPTYTTLVFDEEVKGWVTFYDYRPKHSCSLFSNFYSTENTGLWQHHSSTVPRNSFYGASSVDSSITFIFHPQINIGKTFKTISYEGSNGWEIESFMSDPTLNVDQGGIYYDINDVAKPIKSHNEGLYFENGVSVRCGFSRKENRYVANLVSNNPIRPGEVIIQSEASGIKGFYATVRIASDSTTDLGGEKELFSVASEYSISSY